MWYKIQNYSMKCRLYPNKEQAQKIDAIINAIRIVHNCTWYEMIVNHVNTKEVKDKKDNNKIVHFPNFSSCMKKEWTHKLIAEHSEVGNSPNSAITSSVYGIYADMKKGWEKDGKKPLEFYKPQYYSNKKQRRSYSYQETGSKFSIGENRYVMRVNLAKVGNVKLRGVNMNIRFNEAHDMEFPEYMNTCRNTGFGVTVSKDNCGDYWLVVKLSNVWKWINDTECSDRHDVGVDVGIKDIAITSDGDKYPAKRFARHQKHKKKLLNRAVSRRWGWSNIEFRKAHKSDPSIVPSRGYKKAKQKLARFERTIARRRDNYNHHVSLDIVKKSNLICIEDLNVKGMMSNHHLAYALSDSALYDVLNKLNYKSIWYGRSVKKIGRYDPSSQICSCCGEKNSAVKSLNVRQWNCPNCNTLHDRDINAAKNILAFGLNILNA